MSSALGIRNCKHNPLLLLRVLRLLLPLKLLLLAPQLVSVVRSDTALNNYSVVRNDYKNDISFLKAEEEAPRSCMAKGPGISAEFNCSTGNIIALRNDALPQPILHNIENGNAATSARDSATASPPLTNNYTNGTSSSATNGTGRNWIVPNFAPLFTLSLVDPDTGKFVTLFSHAFGHIAFEQTPLHQGGGGGGGSSSSGSSSASRKTKKNKKRCRILSAGIGGYILL